MLKIPSTIVVTACLVSLAGCAGWTRSDIPVETASAKPGGTVTQKGTPRDLLGTPIGIGGRLPGVELVRASDLQEVDLSERRGSVLLLSIVPSVDTRVCEAQTHALGEEGDRLPEQVERITISRDTPFALQRFAREAGLGDLTYLSDYKEGAFGRATGLLVEGPLLLARSVMVVDREGRVHYLQVVPEMAHLPDMEAAFRAAESLVER